MAIYWLKNKNNSILKVFTIGQIINVCLFVFVEYQKITFMVNYVKGK